MSNLSDIKFWQEKFGVLPLHLNEKAMEERYIMLNGGSSDFCFQTFDENDNEKLFFEYSWSTNTKNYIVLGEEKIRISNWLEKKTEFIPRKTVEDNIEKFYKYIVSKSYKTQGDIVPFIIDLFRQFRNITLEKRTPSEALTFLFRLLISLDEDNLEIDNDKWAIDPLEVPPNFEYYVKTLKTGIQNIKPNLDLILRHTSGVLFQEAHREVLYFDLQKDLFGASSNKLTIKNDAYSSIHYTPQYIARTIVENSLKQLDLGKDQIKILDPSCGSAEFLIETLKQLKSLKYNGKIILRGFDSSESAVQTSKFLLNYENRTQWDSTLEFAVKVVEDSLIEDWSNDNDLILMNPPFVSWELLKEKQSRYNN